MPRFALARSSIRLDETFPDLPALARRIHQLRGGQPILVAGGVQLARRGARPQRETVSVWTLDLEGTRDRLVGYAMAAPDDAPALRATDLRAALAAIAPEAEQLVEAA